MSFSDNGIFDAELREHCLKLNDLLNNVTIQDYYEHLMNKTNEIYDEIRIVGILVSKILFVDLSEIVTILHDFQRDQQISERDHYYHSIQCFLLAIVLFKKFYRSNQIPNNIIAILYSLTMYHDVGYLYKSTKVSEDQINKYLADIFLCSNEINKNKKFMILCLREKPYQPNEIIKFINDKIINTKDIANIWSSEELKNQALLKSNIDPLTIPIEYKKGHAYKSTLMLARLLFIKIIILEYCASTYEIDIHNEEIDWFKEVIKAIYNHGHKTFSPPLNRTSDFYSVYLMIIDELQTYGRLLSEDTRHTLINPKDVGFHWDTVHPNKLVSDIITTDPKLVKECSVHNCRKIKSKLIKRIDKKSLDII